DHPFDVFTARRIRPFHLSTLREAPSDYGETPSPLSSPRLIMLTWRPMTKARRTASELPREGLYGPQHAPDFGQAIGKPGAYPSTRGLHATGYRGRLWTMRQYAGFGTAAESNRRYRYLLDQGTAGLSVAFDLPTQIGYDSDEPPAAGEVGRVGVAI